MGPRTHTRKQLKKKQNKTHKAQVKKEKRQHITVLENKYIAQQSVFAIRRGSGAHLQLNCNYFKIYFFQWMTVVLAINITQKDPRASISQQNAVMLLFFSPSFVCCTCLVWKIIFRNYCLLNFTSKNLEKSTLNKTQCGSMVKEARFVSKTVCGFDFFFFDIFFIYFVVQWKTAPD